MSDLDQDMQTYDMMERYAKGESMANLAAECQIEEATLRKRMRNFKPEEYNKAKGEAAQARIDLRHAENKNILSMNREGLSKALGTEGADISIGDRCKIEKTFGDRVALTDGDVTSREEQVKPTVIVLFKDAKPDDDSE
jgi:hypothetical protein